MVTIEKKINIVIFVNNYNININVHSLGKNVCGDFCTQHVRNSRSNINLLYRLSRLSSLSVWLLFCRPYYLHRQLSVFKQIIKLLRVVHINIPVGYKIWSDEMQNDWYFGNSKLRILKYQKISYSINLSTNLFSFFSNYLNTQSI